MFLLVLHINHTIGHKQEIPNSDRAQAEQVLTRTTSSVNGKPMAQLTAGLRQLLSAKTKPEGVTVVVKSAKDTPYDRWIEYTGYIENTEQKI